MSDRTKSPATPPETLEEAEASIRADLARTGHSAEFINGAIGAERLHGCLRGGAPLWVCRAGAATYSRIGTQPR